MVLVKNWEIFYLVISAKIAKRKRSYDFIETKNTFLVDKNKQLKNSINWDFCKGLSLWFSSKSAKFSIFLFLAKYTREYVSRYFRNKKRLSRP